MEEKTRDSLPELEIIHSDLESLVEEIRDIIDDLHVLAINGEISAAHLENRTINREVSIEYSEGKVIKEIMEFVLMERSKLLTEREKIEGIKKSVNTLSSSEETLQKQKENIQNIASKVNLSLLNIKERYTALNYAEILLRVEIFRINYQEIKERTSNFKEHIKKLQKCLEKFQDIKEGIDSILKSIPREARIYTFPSSKKTATLAQKVS
jgi:GTPase SAR1 family protein